jgi:hypothetical protein
MRWFGETWDAPINDLEHADTPVGQKCERCGEVITEDTRGVLIPGWDDAATRARRTGPERRRGDVTRQVREYPFDLRCHLASIVGESMADILMEELSIRDARAGRDRAPLPPTAYPSKDHQPGDPRKEGA